MKPAELEFEIEFASPAAGAPERHHLHLACFKAWELELQDAELARTAGSSGLTRPASHTFGGGGGFEPSFDTSASRVGLPLTVEDRNIPGGDGKKHQSGRG